MNMVPAKLESRDMSKFSFARSALMVVGALSLMACSGGADSADTGARTQFERSDDRAKGSADAPVTIIEYASVACGGCAAWHETAMPTVQEFVDTGDVRFVMREMLTGQPNLAIAGFMLANCVEDERYYDVIDVLFDQQRALFQGMQTGTAQTQFEAIARSAGLDADAFRTCMTDESNLNAVQERSAQATADGIGSTPTFIVNGDLLETVSHPDITGGAYGVNGEALIDANGPIPASFSGETFERIILYFKNQAEGSAATDGSAG